MCEKKSIVSFLIVISLLFFVPGNCLADGLLHSGDLNYIGAFRVPSSDTDDNGLHFGGNGPAYNPTNNSLYILGQSGKTSEISIPTLKTGLSGGTYQLNLLDTGSFLQSPVDTTEGNSDNIGINKSYCDSCYNGCGTEAQLVWNNLLLATDYVFFDSDSSAALSHFTHSKTLTSSSFQGMFAINNGFNTPGFANGLTSGYMADIPLAYQSQMGGTVLTGAGGGGISVTSRTSNGPCVSSFDPANLGSNPAPAHMLVCYPYGNTPLGAWGSGVTQYIGIMDWIHGVVFSSNTHSVLFFGRHDTGADCYGPGTGNQSEACCTFTNGVATSCHTCDGNICNGVTVSGGDSCCYDLTSSSKGDHGYPYVDYVWAYDVGNSDGTNTTGNNVSSTGSTPGKNNLTAAKLDQINPWDLVPYAVWTLPTHFDGADSGNLLGTTYDSVSRKLYISIGGADNANSMYYDLPLIEVYQVAGGGPSDTTAPAAPGGLSVM